MRRTSADHGTPRPLLVFGDDWGRHPSSVQHLVARLLPTRDVLWVNTIGTRPPRLDLRTAGRVVEKLGHWLRPAGLPAPTDDVAADRPSPRIVAPKMWPSFASPLAREVNRRLLARALVPQIERLHAPPIALTTLPIVADLVGVLPVERWVYYCVDDFAHWPDYDGATMQAMERALVPKVDATVAASEALAEGLSRLGATPTLLTHGVDVDAWCPDPPATVPAELEGLQRPWIVFWGVVDRRMDVEWLRTLSAGLARGTIVLVGPGEAPDPELGRLPRVVRRPPVAFERLPALAACADVLVMPYVDSPATRAMQPLKLKEYLATGRPTVVRALPATRPWSAACDVVETPEAFRDAVLSRIAQGPPEDQLAARAILEDEGWDAKARSLATVIDREPDPELAAPRGTAESLTCAD